MTTRISEALGILSEALAAEGVLDAFIDADSRFRDVVLGYTYVAGE